MADLRLPSAFVGAATFAPGHGGIARVARMSARALLESGCDLDFTAFLDMVPQIVAGRSAGIARGSKFGFAAQVHRAALLKQYFLFDSVGIARAYPRLPGLRRPNAVWMHGLEVWEGMRSDYRRALARADMLLANSHHTLARHEQVYGPVKYGRVCWLATEEDEAPTEPARFEGPPCVLIVGRLETTEGRKGHDDLLACWPEVASAVPGARLLIAGAGSGLETMRERVRTSAAPDNIEVLGFVPEAKMPALFARAHVFAMPSRQEGFGIAYVEAMRFGLPVIAAIHDAGGEVNVNCVTGFNVDLERKHEFAERLIFLLKDAGRARSMGQAGFLRWREHFRYSSFAARFLLHWREFARL